MTFSRFSVEPIVVIGSHIYIIHIQSGSRSSVIHSCRKYWNRAAKVPVVPVSSSLTLVSISGTEKKASQLTDFPMYIKMTCPDDMTSYVLCTYNDFS
ncbi:conserved hypothetical protein [Trichinella spiralis]|uniref:hypothetical protein n=1 Tax=Trichinella spiralis TaxID=6334 RepID=UPI0001EFD6AA|nr:conserved hypothetical protein [Trichinella spiralis]